MYSAGACSRARASSLRYTFMCSFCTRLMDSRPPATTVCIPSTTICFAAIDTLISPEEHWRSMVWPDTLIGSPAATAHCRATLKPWVPSCSAAPMMRSSISPGSSPARLITSLITGAARVGAVVSLKAPRYALPMGVRAVDTMTASLIKAPLLVSECTNLYRLIPTHTTHREPRSWMPAGACPEPGCKESSLSPKAYNESRTLGYTLCPTRRHYYWQFPQILHLVSHSV